MPRTLYGRNFHTPSFKAHHSVVAPSELRRCHGTIKTARARDASHPSISISSPSTRPAPYHLAPILHLPPIISHILNGSTRITCNTLALAQPLYRQPRCAAFWLAACADQVHLFKIAGSCYESYNPANPTAGTSCAGWLFKDELGRAVSRVAEFECASEERKY
jgi:hypothetical protein